MEKPNEDDKKVKVVMPTEEKDKKIQPQSSIEFSKYEAGGWEFYHSVQGMSSEKEMDQVSDKVGIMGLPEVFYGFNHLYIANKEHNILLDFNAVDSLSFSGFEKRRQFFHPNGVDLFKKEKKEGNEEEAGAEEITEGLEKLVLGQSGLSEAEKALNYIDVIPAAVQVAMAGFWKGKDTSKIKDYKSVNFTSDWSYSTAYKGTVRYLSTASKAIEDETNLSINFNKEAKTDNLSVVQVPEAKIPFDKLSPENPILHFGEVYLFESDLEDCGYSMSKIRFRVMADCFYILVRFYLRVDGMTVRAFDTRIFHEFGTDNIHREFQYRESSYDELRTAGFDLSSEWLLNPNQSDMVFP